jgi:hypothetical protein
MPRLLVDRQENLVSLKLQGYRVFAVAPIIIARRGRDWKFTQFIVILYAEPSRNKQKKAT